MEIPFARSGEKLRMDMDLAAMAPGGTLSQAMSKMTTIRRGDKKVSYTLYPNAKRYLARSEAADNKDERNAGQKKRIGSEVIDKYRTDKYKVTIRYRDGRVEEGFIWNARDLDELTIRSEVGNSDFRTTTEFKNIVLKAPAASLFEVPVDYTEAQNAMELMMDAK
jgi:hypothetical protein